jgi:hypothetical protein
LRNTILGYSFLGDEIFLYYGYTPALFPSDFPWYHELKKRVEEEDKRLKKKLSRKTKEKIEL